MSELSLLSDREGWHCSIERELCLTIVVAGAGPPPPGRCRRPPPGHMRALAPHAASRLAMASPHAALTPPEFGLALLNAAGASGDLASKKTYPALQFLFQNGCGRRGAAAGGPSAGR